MISAIDCRGAPVCAQAGAGETRPLPNPSGLVQPGQHCAGGANGSALPSSMARGDAPPPPQPRPRPAQRTHAMLRSLINQIHRAVGQGGCALHAPRIFAESRTLRPAGVVGLRGGGAVRDTEGLPGLIRSRYRAGASMATIAREFGVSTSTVRRHLPVGERRDAAAAARSALRRAPLHDPPEDPRRPDPHRWLDRAVRRPPGASRWGDPPAVWGGGELLRSPASSECLPGPSGPGFLPPSGVSPARRPKSGRVVRRRTRSRGWPAAGRRW